MVFALLFGVVVAIFSCFGSFGHLDGFPMAGMQMRIDMGARSKHASKDRFQGSFSGFIDDVLCMRYVPRVMHASVGSLQGTVILSDYPCACGAYARPAARSAAHCLLLTAYCLPTFQPASLVPAMELRLCLYLCV